MTRAYPRPGLYRLSFKGPENCSGSVRFRAGVGPKAWPNQALNIRRGTHKPAYNETKRLWPDVVVFRRRSETFQLKGIPKCFVGQVFFGGLGYISQKTTYVQEKNNLLTLPPKAARPKKQSLTQPSQSRIGPNTRALNVLTRVRWTHRPPTIPVLPGRKSNFRAGFRPEPN
jgi:hypothetical protein